MQKRDAADDIDNGKQGETYREQLIDVKLHFV
jgi:hypothetical protein